MDDLNTAIPTSLKAALDTEVERTKPTLSSIVTAALSQYLDLQLHTLFQVSTSGVHVAGVYERELSVQAILEHGNFGLGTFANLDGEMVVVDGHVYQVRGSGEVSRHLATQGRLSPLSPGSNRKLPFEFHRYAASRTWKRAATAFGGPETSSTPSGSTEPSSECGPGP